tara:strand:+ start:2411 stop:3565 length:1155 start_codon:yes stop_codon:yes gene_type:complete
LLVLACLSLFIVIVANQPRSVTKNDAMIHCNITNIMSFNDMDPYLEENIKKVYPENFPVQIEKIGTNYLPLVIKSLKLFCHPYINWIENYRYFLAMIPTLFILFNFKNNKNNLTGFALVLMGFNGLYQALRSGNISIIAQLILLVFFISLLKKKTVVSSLLFSLVAYIKITILPIYVFLLFARKNKEVKKFLIYSSSFLIFLLLLTYLLEKEVFVTWIKYYNIFSNSENINNFNVLNDTFGNYYDTPSVPNLLFYLYNTNLILFFLVSSSVLLIMFLTIREISNNKEDALDIFMNTFVLYFLINPYIRTYHLIEIAIFLAFYIKNKNVKWHFLIIFFCLIPQITLLEIGFEIIERYSTVLISLYPPILLLLFILTEKINNNKAA